MKNGKRFSGTLLYVRIMQIASLLPLVYAFGIAGSPGIVTTNNVLTFFFDLGVSALPRAESCLLSLFFRLSLSEMLVCFLPAVLALIAGIVAQRYLTGAGKGAQITRAVLAVLLGADLIVRLLPLSFNGVFGLAAETVAFVIRFACLLAVLWDLCGEKVVAKFRKK